MRMPKTSVLSAQNPGVHPMRGTPFGVEGMLALERVSHRAYFCCICSRESLMSMTETPSGGV